MKNLFYAIATIAAAVFILPDLFLVVIGMMDGEDFFDTTKELVGSLLSVDSLLVVIIFLLAAMAGRMEQ